MTFLECGRPAPLWPLRESLRFGRLVNVGPKRCQASALKSWLGKEALKT